MIKAHLSIDDIRAFLSEGADRDQLRKYYVYQLGSTFLWLGVLENSLIDAMAMCEAIRIPISQDINASSADLLLKKIDVFKDSTFGGLLKILQNNNFSEAEINYLKWTKSKRDFFIHRFFHNRPWPGDVDDRDVFRLCRQILYLEHIFRRASGRVFNLFARSGLMASVDLGEDGRIFLNHGLMGPEDSELQDFIVDVVRDRAKRQRE